MNNVFIWIILGFASILLGTLLQVARTHKTILWLEWFFEIWTGSLGFFFAAIIGYFFIAVRAPQLIKSGEISVSDFILAIIFTFAILGWWPHIVKNITEGIGKTLGSIIDKAIGK